MARTGAPGAAVVVVQNGNVILAQSYGLADRERQSPWDARQTTFIAKSVSKLFTATAVMQLVEHGRIDLDADVNGYLSTWKAQNPFPQPIRVRDLLTHTTGIEDRGLGTMTAGAEDVTPLGTYLQDRLLPAIFPPGTRFSYADHNTTLADYLVELRSGMPFAQYMHERVLDPIGMSNSSFAQPPARRSGRAHGGGVHQPKRARRAQLFK
jgi:CubicO group peptidase (beta-lactamase class C family)